MSLSWALPLPIVLAPQTEDTLSDILAQSFGSVSDTISGAWLYYDSVADLSNWDFSYWNPSSPMVGTWYSNGTAIGPDTSSYISSAAFGSAVFQAGDDIGPYASVYVGSAWYSMITVAPALVNLPVGNREPTPADIIAEAYRFNSYYGFVPNDNDCHNIATAVSAAVGAVLPDNSGSLDPTQNQDGGFWRVVYRGSDPNPVSNWQTLVKPGDIVRMGWTGGGQHTTTVLAVNPDGSIVVYDNAYWPNGVEGTGIHTVNYDTQTITSDITIYRLTTDDLYLQTGDNAGDTILGTIFDDKIVGGTGNDTLTGGLGNDVFQDYGGTNTIDGGGGTNFVDLSNLASSQATLVKNTDGSWTLNAANTDLTDTLTNIETVRFSDRSVALRPGASSDLSGSGTSDVILSNGTSVIDWMIQIGTYAGYNTIGNSNGYSVVGSGDFNRDGTSDVLLESPTGDVANWIIQNGTYLATNHIGYAQAYGVVGTGDFNGDGTADVLLINGAGDVIDWRVLSGTYQGYDNLGNASGYGVVGTGDYSGNGTTDVLLENGSGSVIDWMIQNGALLTWHNIGNASGYGVVGQGDFTGNGTTDVLLENSSGQVIDWMMQNGQFAGWNNVGNAAGYGIVATGDYDGNGMSDILLENNAGNVVEWQMQNGTFVGWHTVGNAAGYTVKHA